MAVPFYMPEDDENPPVQQQQTHQQQQPPQHQTSAVDAQQPSVGMPPLPPQQQQHQQRYYVGATSAAVPIGGNNSATSATTQTPLQNPVSGELVQAIYDALYLLSNSVAGTPVYASPPASPSCAGYNNNTPGNVFFSRIPHNHHLTSGGRDENMTPQRPPQWQHPRNLNMPRSRLNSTGSTDEFFVDEFYTANDFESPASSSSFSSPSYQRLTSEQYNYQQQQLHAIAMNRMNLEMSLGIGVGGVGGTLPIVNEFNIMHQAREFLPEFSGEIPVRKKMPPKTEQHHHQPAPDMTPAAPPMSTTSAPSAPSMIIANNKNNVHENKEGAVDLTTKPKINHNHQKFVWPTVVTAFALAIGCGFFVTR